MLTYEIFFKEICVLMWTWYLSWSKSCSLSPMFWDSGFSSVFCCCNKGCCMLSCGVGSYMFNCCNRRISYGNYYGSARYFFWNYLSVNQVLICHFLPYLRFSGGIEIKHWAKWVNKSCGYILLVKHILLVWLNILRKTLSVFQLILNP